MRRLVAVVGGVVAAALVASSLVAQTLTPYGEWTHSVTQDDFSGETTEMAYVSGESLMLFVHCLLGEDYTLSLYIFGDGAIFRDGDVALRWDEGPIERYTFQDDNESLSAATRVGADDYLPELRPIITKLGAHSELRVRAARWPNTTVTDRLSLSGAGQAIAALECAD